MVVDGGRVVSLPLYCAMCDQYHPEGYIHPKPIAQSWAQWAGYQEKAFETKRQLAIERQHEADWLRALPTPSQAKH